MRVYAILFVYLLFICIPSFKANPYCVLALSKILKESLLQLSLTFLVVSKVFKYTQIFITAKVLLASSVVMVGAPHVTRMKSCTYKRIDNIRFETLWQWMFRGKLTLNFTCCAKTNLMLTFSLQNLLIISLILPVALLE